MTGFLIRMLIAAAGLWLASEIVPSVRFDSTGSLLAAALVWGVVNAVVRPIAVVLTFPITMLTLGLFLFVINAAMFGLVAALLPGFSVGGFGAALFGSIIVSVTSWIAARYVGPSGRIEIMVVSER